MILPSSRITVDRPIIQRHLLSDNVSISYTLTIKLHTSLSLSEDFEFSTLNLIPLLLLQHDPFNRAHLTSDMLIPDIELKAKIDEFVKSHQSKKRTSGEDSSNKERIHTTSSDMLID